MPEASEDEGYNELLIQWLTDLRMGAKRNNSKAEFTYLKVREKDPNCFIPYF